MYIRHNDFQRSSQRRRLSDSSAAAELSEALRPLSVRSVDGSRWLPNPDEQSRRSNLAERPESTAEHAEASSLPQHSCSEAVCAIAKVFETTELLESILSFLDTRDVLLIRRTNKHWNSTVYSSPYLRLHFFTYPQWERPPTDYQLLPFSLPGINVEKDEPIERGQWVKVSMTLDAARRICPAPKQRVRSRSIFEGLRGGLGRSSNDAWPASTAATVAMSSELRYEDLQIAQPPLLGMQAHIIHRSLGPDSPSSGPPPSPALRCPPPSPFLASRARPDSNSPAVAKLSCDAGITLGFLAETAQELIGSLKSGPSHESEVKVVFKAIVSFSEGEVSPRKGTRRKLRTVTRIG